MKKFLIIMLTFIAACPHLAAQEGCITLVLRDSSHLNFAFTEKPRIVPTSESLEISTSDGTKTVVEIAEVRYILTNDKIPTTIKPAANKSNVVFSLKDNMVRIYSLKPGEWVHVYSIAGLALQKCESDNNGNASINLESFAERTFIIRTTSGIVCKMSKP